MRKFLSRLICLLFGHIEAKDVRYHSQICVVDKRHGGSTFGVACDRCGAIYVRPFFPQS